MTHSQEELEAARQIFAEIGTAERHFNEVQSRYRAMASTWLLAGFAGMGFVATNKDLPLPYQPIVFGIGLAAATGISLIWILDEIVFRNLLGAYFIEGLRFEQRYPELPQARHNMLRLFSRLPVRRYVSTFYAACIAVPALAGFTVAFNWLFQPTSIPLKVFFLAVLLGILILATELCFHGRGSEYSRMVKEVTGAKRAPMESSAGVGSEQSAESAPNPVFKRTPGGAA